MRFGIILETIQFSREVTDLRGNYDGVVQAGSDTAGAGVPAS